MAWLWEKLSFFNLNVQLLAPECVFAWKWIYTYILTISTPVALIIFGLLILLLRVLHTLMARTLGSSLRRFFPTRDCKSMDPLCNYHNLCKDCHARPAQERPNPGLTGPPCGSGRQLWISKKRYQMGMFLTKAAKRDQYVDMFMGETRVLLTFLKIGYIFLSSATIGYFDCVGKDVVGGRQYLDADPTLECYK